MFVLYVRFRHQLEIKKLEFNDLDSNINYSVAFIQNMIVFKLGVDKDINSAYIICDPVTEKELPPNAVIKNEAYLILLRLPCYFKV